MRYAMIDVTTNVVINVFDLADGETWTPPDGFETVASDTANIGDIYADGAFAPPPPPPPPVLTPAELLAANTATQKTLMYVTNDAIAALFMAIDLASATGAEADTARAWQVYFKDVMAVDLTLEAPSWPQRPV